MTPRPRTVHPLPVARLTLRQFVGGKAVRVVVALALLPLVFALIYLLRPEIESPTTFLGEIVYLNLMIPTLMPLTVLVLATGALGHEIEDRTLHYLTLKPISRLQIVLEKFLASFLVSGVLLMIGITLTYAVVMRGDAGSELRLLVAMLVSALVAALAYASIFLLVSLLVSRPLLVALVYSLLWESLLGRFVPGLRYVSIRHFVSSVFVDIADDSRLAVAHATGLWAALATLGIAVVVALALATWRLRTMNLN
ncbi:MAG: ABC transporter permease [Thermoleophilia bacterium]